MFLGERFEGRTMLQVLVVGNKINPANDERGFEATATLSTLGPMTANFVKPSDSFVLLLHD
jgi:hypothetical protein